MISPQHESIEEFLKNAQIEPEYAKVTEVIRDVLSKWLGVEATSIISSMPTKEMYCRGWDSTEFMWQVLYELELDLVDSNTDFPDLFPSNFPFFSKKKTYRTIGEWVKDVLGWYVSSSFETLK
ncbi:MAG: hypothetical protein LBL62_00950 [Planctomycetaceae bacterium]|jgi:hypothetical protein|nr:hypothetical protein [Planctomycetaceae bacterium]